VASGLEQRLRRLDGAVQHGAQVDMVAPQLQAIGRDPRDVEQIVRQPYQLMELPAHDRQGAFLQPRILTGATQQLQRIAQRCERIAQLVGERRQELVLAAVGFAQHLFGVAALGHIDTDTDASVDCASRIVEWLDVVLHVDDAAVGAHDFDVIGDARAVRDGVLHRELVGRNRMALTLDPIPRLFAGRRVQRDVDVGRDAEQARQRIIRRDEAALRIVGNGNWNGRALEHANERRQPCPQLVGARIVRQVERRYQVHRGSLRRAALSSIRLTPAGRPPNLVCISRYVCAESRLAAPLSAASRITAEGPVGDVQCIS
jgi:hypothetical protein